MDIRGRARRDRGETGADCARAADYHLVSRQEWTLQYQMKQAFLWQGSGCENRVPLTTSPSNVSYHLRFRVVEVGE